MKKRNILVLTALASMALLSACDNGGSGGGSGGGGSGASQYDGKITVNFFVDYNAAAANKEFTIGGENLPDTYDVQTVDRGAKVTKPADPTAPFPEFPTFLGWSQKEFISSTNDLWNFDSDTINPEEGATTFSLFGIWDV